MKLKGILNTEILVEMPYLTTLLVATIKDLN